MTETLKKLTSYQSDELSRAPSYILEQEFQQAEDQARDFEYQADCIIEPANLAFYQNTSTLPYIIVFTLNPVDQVPIWLTHIERFFDEYDIALIYRHPTQILPINLFEDSLGVLLWNGTLPVFDSLKDFLNQQSIAFSFMECGFFPQTEHVYFDKNGINVECSLANNQLAWLPCNYQSIVANKREVFFKNVPTYTLHEDYIFVPLQLGNDSNIQLNSRFVNGMQHFVDYIEKIYPNEVIVFKSHPRDSNTYKTSSKTSYWSEACSRSLIKGAKKVHGINSTVLFEARLFGTETEIEGDCLLTRHPNDQDKMLAAIILWQFSLKEGHQELLLDKIAERSYLRLTEYL